MILVRNLTVLTVTAATTAVLAIGTIGFLAPPPTPPPPNTGTGGTTPPTVVDKTNRPFPVTTEPAPNTTGFSSGKTGAFDPSIPLLAKDFATVTVDEWSVLIDQERLRAGAPLLVYDPALAQVAANLLTDVIANNPITTGFVPNVVNSKMETPIQQVKTQIQGSPATAASALLYVQTNSNTNVILVQVAHTETIVGSLTGKQVADSKGWTHYGIAVKVAPAVPAQSNEAVYFVVFFARYVP